MEQRALGSTGVSISLIGQGTWMMERDRAASVAALRRGLELGMSHIDTAEKYGDGACEEIVGEAIAGRRDEVFVASKVLPDNATYKGTIRACERSLKRLRTDRIDLYLLHWRESRPLEPTLRAFEQLVADGKIRFFGVSNFDVDDIEEAVAIAGAGRIASTIGSTRSKQASSARRTGLRLARLGVECGEDGAARAPRPPESPCRPLGSTARGCCYSGGRQMAQTQTKEVVRQLLDRLPDDCTIEDVQYHLYVIASVEQGRAEITAGQGIPHEQVKAELRRKWLRPDDE